MFEAFLEKRNTFLHIGDVGAHLQELSDQVMPTEETAGKKRGHTIAIIIIEKHWGVVQELPHTGHIPRPKRGNRMKEERGSEEV